MSKKSRKRNKKILAALALAGGAAMLAKGRGKGIAQGVSGADKAAFTSDAAYKLPSKAAVATDIAADVAPSNIGVIGKMQGAGNAETQIANQITRANAAKRAAKNAAMNYQRSQTFDAQHRTPILDPMRHQYALKGGGIAKRGKGAAYKSGGRVKSMGIAKRGGGAAKR